MTERTPKLPSVAEVLRHPAFPTAVFNLEPSRRGRIAVAEGRGGPFNVAWQIHGGGPIKILFISGLGGQRTIWQRQTLYFGHEHGDRYSVLLVDNRGIGDSDVPLMRYTTADMAYDVAEVLAHVGWIAPDSLPPPAMTAAPVDGSDESTITGGRTTSSSTNSSSSRQLHVAGLSLGGMIAQELAVLMPGAISSLSLCCTAAEIVSTTTFAKNMAARLALIVPQGLELALPASARRMFPSAWLLQPDDILLPEPGSPNDNVKPPAPNPAAMAALPKTLQKLDAASKAPPLGPQEEQQQPQDEGSEYRLFPTNYHRFAAQEMHKRLDVAHYPSSGFLLQLIAAGRHRKTAAQLRALGDAVGRERILVMHGTLDNMIKVPHGETLIALLRPGEGLIVEGMGHAPLLERWQWYNDLLEKRFALGEKLDGRASG